ncbi:HGF [Branchiostoma lanceolatum]|uniref:HGF protein n=1 Tax=Branchiostoma lanceolatum TaxID=7740 RepID=A0A8K0A203_BRALA|nr:HGF [Branchiostoma lanceolatum]
MARIAALLLLIFAVHWECSSAQDCYYGNGESYRGPTSQTVSGLTCQSWNQQSPHPHIFQPSLYPTAGLDGNACRNPLGVDAKPWCYTTDPGTEFELCDVDECVSECYYGNGESYRGDATVTESGLTCQAWDQQTPHTHIFRPTLYPDSGLEQNFCRNPLGVDAKPWCYTTDPATEFETCAVNACPTTPAPPTTTASSCTDTNPHCASWASTGECDANPDYMLVQCAQSCGNCGGSDPNIPVGCSSGWSTGPSSCFLVVNNYVTWQQASDDCVSKGGHLATIGTYDEESFIQGLTNYDYQPYWIGLHDTGAEGTFIWVDGTPLTYTSWNFGEPNNNGDEDCVQLSGYNWNDAYCGGTAQYICEIDTGGAPTCGATLTDAEGVIESPGYPAEYGNNHACVWTIENPDQAPINIWFEEFDVECDYDFLLITDGDKQHTYTCKLDAGLGCSYTTTDSIVKVEFTSDSSVTAPGFRLRYASVLSDTAPPPIFPHQLWADRTCNATIELASQFTHSCPDGWTGGLSSCYLFQQDLKPWATARVDCQRRGGDLASVNSDAEWNWIIGQTLGSFPQYWIGLHDTAGEGTFVWSDRSPVTVTYWNFGEPNNAGTGEDCVEIGGTSWNDSPCSNNNRYICEIRLETATIDCDFDTDVCGYTNDSTADFSWNRLRGWTPQSNTGPLADHTTGSGYYMLTQATPLPNPGAKVSFSSPTIDVYTHACLRFVYHIYGFDMGTLNVHVEGPRGKTTIFSTDGNNTNTWLKANIEVEAGSFRVVFEAERGTNPNTNIAIDDVQLTEGFCIACPSGWTATENSCYKFVQVQKSWQEARDDCRSQGAGLVSVDSAAEHTWLQTQVDYYQPWWWIGLNDLGTETSFSWSNGRPLTVSYWIVGEPNDSSGNEDCVEMQGSYQQAWNDQSCSMQNYYICEISKDSPIVIDTSDGPIDVGSCYSGNGDKYRGTANTTVSGYDCQAWGEQRPHLHVFDAESYPEAGLDGNYCRNPDGAARPWCYTTDTNVRWEYCDLQACADGGTDLQTSAPIPDYQIRLVGGVSFGRVEVFYNGQWGTVCDDNFMKEDADVVCRELGFPAALQFYPDAYFEPGEGPIWLDEVTCTGREISLQFCPNSGWGVTNCNHNEDVGVSCLEAKYGEKQAVKKNRAPSFLKKMFGQ